MHPIHFFSAFAVISGIYVHAAFVASQSSSAQVALPTIDLGYAIYQGTVNNSASYYNFSNVRYASAPRFSAPVPINSTNRTIDNGQNYNICPQALPFWNLIENEYLAERYFPNISLQANISSQYAALQGLLAGSNATNISPSTLSKLFSLIPPPTAGTTEDCLTIDIIVPQSVFNGQTQPEISRKKSSKASSGAPVLVWIFGGGYVEGDKISSGMTNGGALVERSQAGGKEGIIYITINYRVGVYGFMSGPTFQQDGTANAGFHDQRFALNWIQKYVHLFGGDPNRVTIFGESAGGGSVMHQITAYGGNKGKAPFARALSQSPGFVPLPKASEQENMFEKTLSTASMVAQRNISTLEELRTLNDTELYYTNYALIGSAPYGTFFAGPAVDGDFVPALPGQLLLEGRFDHSVKLMTSFAERDGTSFTNPFITNDNQLHSYLRDVFPGISDSTLSYITTTLYPAVFNGSYPYTTYVDRTATLVAELAFNCNNQFLNDAFGSDSYAYYFTVPPALHGDDFSYTFYGDDNSPSSVYGLSVNTTLATAIQDYILSFAITGSPSGLYSGIPTFPKWGNDSTMLNVNITDFGKHVKAPTANERCTFWQKELYYR